MTSLPAVPFTRADRPSYGLTLVPTPLYGVTRKAVSVQEAAQLMDVSESSVMRRILEGKLPAFKFGARWRILAANLSRFVENGLLQTRQRVGKVTT